MKSIKVLGTGCPKCKQTIKLLEDVISETSTEASVEKIEDIQAIMTYDVMSTPAVVVDEVVKIKGRVPTKAEVEALLAG